MALADGLFAFSHPILDDYIEAILSILNGLGFYHLSLFLSPFFFSSLSLFLFNFSIVCRTGCCLPILLARALCWSMDGFCVRAFSQPDVFRFLLIWSRLRICGSSAASLPLSPPPPFRQTRCLLTSIATNHVATGLLVTAWNIYPSLVGCWPYGVLLCQIQVSLFTPSTSLVYVYLYNSFSL